MTFQRVKNNFLQELLDIPEDPGKLPDRPEPRLLSS